MAMSSGGWRRRRRKLGWRHVRGLFGTRAVRRGAAILVGLLLIYYLLGVSISFYNSSDVYAGMGIGDDRAAVLYGVGVPTQVRTAPGPWRTVTKPDMAADGWAYGAATGGRVEVTFDPATGAGRRITCYQPDAQPFACPGLFGIDLGANETTVTRHLGRPTREMLVGETKVMTYADIGAEFALKQYTVYRITAITGPTGGFRRVKRFFRTLIP